MHRKKLIIEICNHIKLGQWELARASIQTFLKRYPSNKKFLYDLLLSVTVHPEFSSIGSPSLPTPFHLSWLSLCLLKEIESHTNAEENLIGKIIFFHLLLQKANEICSSEIIKDLSNDFIQLQCNEDEASISQIFNSELESYIFNVLEKNTLLGCYILCILKVPDDFKCSDLVSSTILNLMSKWLNRQISKLNESSDECKISIEKNIEIMLHFMNYLTQSTFPPYFSKFMEELSELCGPQLPKSVIYSSLMSYPDSELLRTFCNVEDKKLHRLVNQEHLSIEASKEYLKNVYCDLHSIDVKEGFLRSCKNNVHMLGFTLSTLQVLIQNGHYTVVCNYLEHDFIKKFRPLLILLQWDRITSDSEAVYILNHLWPESLNKEPFDPLLVEECDKLIYGVQLAQWCISKSRNNLNMPNSIPSINEFCATLNTHSVLYVLNMVLYFPCLNSEEIYEILQKYTFTSGKAVNIKKKEKSVHFVEEVIDKKTIEQKRDIMIFRSYNILELIMDLIYKLLLIETNQINDISKSNPEDAKMLWKTYSKNEPKTRGSNIKCKEVSQQESSSQVNISKTLDAIKEELKNLYPLAYRLEILENIFSLLFVTQSDLQEELGSDFEDGHEGDDWIQTEVQVNRKVIPGTEGAEEDFQDELDVKKNNSVQFKRTYSGNMSSCSSSSFTVTHLGFLCEDLFIKELLLCLKECLMEISLELDKQKQNANYDSSLDKNVSTSVDLISQNLSRLNKYVSEAQWRYQLVISDNHNKINKVFTDSSVNPCLIYLIDDGEENKESKNRKGRRVKKRSITGTPFESSVKTDSASEISQSGDLSETTKSSHRWSFSSNKTADWNTRSFRHKTMNGMLSSSIDLLNTCLLQGDLSKASQVIQIFGMEKSETALEIQFAQNFQNVVKQLLALKANMLPLMSAIPLSRSTSHNLGHLHPMTNLSQIALTAAAGVNATSEITLVDELLSGHSVPNVPEYALLQKIQLSSDIKNLLNCFNPQALIFIDLSCTIPTQTETCLSFLSSAEQRIIGSDEQNARSKRILFGELNLTGLFNFVEQITKYLEEVSNLRRQNFSPFILSSKRYGSICRLLLQGTKDLHGKEFSEQLCDAECLQGSINKCLSILTKGELQNQDIIEENSSKFKDGMSSLQNIVDFCSSKLKSHFSKSCLGSSDMEKFVPDYLKTFSSYIKELGSLLSKYDFSKEVPTTPLGYLTVIDEGLTTSLGKLILEKGVHPKQLEEFALRMNLDLMHIIIQCCCNQLPCNLYLPKHDSGKYVLNCSKGITDKVDDPEVFTRELLTEILNLFQVHAGEDSNIVKEKKLKYIVSQPEVSTLFEKTNRLAEIDLFKLDSQEKCLTFLINVSNLLVLHSELNQETYEIVNGPQCILTSHFKKIMKSQAISYCIGQLGNISIFELHCMILGKHVSGLNFPQESNKSQDLKKFFELIVPFPKAIFVLHEMFLDSPKLQVISPDTINEQINDAMNSYMNAHCVIGSLELKLPELFQWYKELVSDSEDILSFAGSQNIEIFSNFFSQHILTDENGEQKMTFEDSFHIINLPFSIEKACVLQYQIGEFSHTEAEDSNDDIDFDLLKETVPDAVYSYLKTNCWLASVIIDISRARIMNKLEICPIFERLLSLHLNNEELLKILLYPLKQVSFMSKYLDAFLKGKNWIQMLSWIKQIIPSCPELLDFLSPLCDLLLYQLAIESLKTDPDLSYEHAIKLKNPLLRAYCVEKCYKQWSSDKCLFALQLCGSDSCLPSWRSQELLLLFKQVQIYDKICKLVEIPWLNERPSWQKIQEVTVQDPDHLLEAIMEAGEFRIALDWTDIHPVPVHLWQAIDVSYLMSLLDSSSPDITSSLQLLQKIEPHAMQIEVCEQLLQRLNNLNSSTFVLDYLLINLGNSLTTENRYKFQLHWMGIKILRCIPVSAWKYYSDLVQHPFLLLEQLMMNAKIEILEKSVHSIKSDIDNLELEFLETAKSTINRLLEKYARKSLDFRVIQTDILDRSFRESSFKKTELNFTSDESIRFVMPQQPPKREDWVPDNAVTKCMICFEDFSMFNRRHHCRRCGRVICSACSGHREVVAGYDIKVRICVECFEQHFVPSRDSSSNQSLLERRVKAYFIGDPEPISQDEAFVPVSPNDIAETVKENFIWKLHSDAEHNEVVRNEFSYDQAPSVSLCLGIMDLHLDHNEGGYYLLTFCDEMFKMLQPLAPGVINPEIDCRLVISMIESLLVSAKVKFTKALNNEGMAKCDTYLNRVDIVKSLVTANCWHLIPSGNIINNDIIRRLRDMLMEQEKWSLALEIATKSGLSVAGIWASWGMLFLKMGDFDSAREKFRYCLEKPKDRKQLQQGESLLLEILAQLEKLSHQPEDKISTLNCLANLKKIKTQGVQISDKQNYMFTSQVMRECQYYLDNYGSHMNFVAFYVQHQMIKKALLYILEEKCDGDVFVEGIFMKCLQKGDLSQLEEEMKNIDPTLEKWSKYLTAVCRYLKRRNLLHVLYHVQKFLQDYIRAAMMCIKFYQENAFEYNELFQRVHHLQNARHHLEIYLEQHSSFQKPSHPVKTIHSTQLLLTMSLKEVNRYINAVNLQIEITKFLHRNSSRITHLPFESNSENTKIPQPLTLFGNQAEKAHLAAMVMLSGNKIEDGFGIAYRIIQEFHLINVRVYCITGRHLVKNHRYPDVAQLISCIQSSGHSRNDVCDEVIISCIHAMEKKMSDSSEMDEIDTLVKLITDDSKRIDAYILCGKLKSAYLLAVRCNRVSDVQRIKATAERTGQLNIQKICEKWLAAQS